MWWPQFRFAAWARVSGPKLARARRCGGNSGTGGSLTEMGSQAVTYVAPVTDDSLAAAMMAISQDVTRAHARLAGIS